MGALTVTFAGGFVWAFATDETATVGLVDAKGSKYQHQMVVAVDRGKVVAGETTLKDLTSGDPGTATFQLLGDAKLTLDGLSLPPGKKLGRTVSTKPPSDPNDFFHIYRIGRLADGTPPRLSSEWQKRLTVRLPLSSGELSVTDDNRQPCTFEDADGNPVAEKRELATVISYEPNSKPKVFVEFADNVGKVRFSASADLEVTIKALCNCGSEQVPEGARLPGFADVFLLYDALPKEFQVHPKNTTIMDVLKLAAFADGSGFVTPGPDCPPTEHPLP